MSGADLLPWSGLVTALGWTLVHFLWQGCVIAVLFWLVCALSRPGSSHLRYWSGVGSLALAVVALGSTFAIYYEPDAVFLPAGPAPESVNTFLVLSGSTPDIWGLAQDGIEPALPLVVVLWLCGVLVLTTRTALDWMHVRGLVHRGVGEVEDCVVASARRIERQLGLRRAVRILVSTRVAVPMAVGLLKPVILLPAGVLVRLPHEQLEMVLAHELGHIRRCDHVVNWLQIALETLLFYHPGIRWISQRVREERENCCDDLVVARCRKPATYARALANLELLRGPVPAVAVMAATGGNLVTRIRRIIDTELPRTSLGYAQLSLMALLALVVGLGAHQGIVLSRALNQVASVAQLQPSDVEWKTWGRSRAVWGDGLAGLAEGREPWAAAERAVSSQPLLELPEPALPRGSREAPRLVEVPKPPEPTLPETAPPTSEPRQSVQPQPAAILASDGLGHVAAARHTVFELAQQQGAAAKESRPREPGTPAAPVVLEQVEPHYPRRARVRDVEGFVELAFSVNEDGRTYDIEVVEAIPSGIFERESRRALRQWKFAPLPETGSARRLTQTFNFDLEDAPSTDSRRNCMMTGRRTCSGAVSPTVVVYVNPPRDQIDDSDHNHLN